VGQARGQLAERDHLLVVQPARREDPGAVEFPRAARWHDLVDLDAGRVATGEATVEEVGWALFRMNLAAASGTRKPRPDRWSLYNALAQFNPGPVT